ncbi:MAG: hypothetical protein EOP50_19680 [Sphingobacteriales bacterium]|nr:MAG: hypothetical protein EOP50_19680 [Sphingobacteriales bacterium]
MRARGAGACARGVPVHAGDNTAAAAARVRTSPRGILAQHPSSFGCCSCWPPIDCIRRLLVASSPRGGVTPTWMDAGAEQEEQQQQRANGKTRHALHPWLVSRKEGRPETQRLLRLCLCVRQYASARLVKQDRELSPHGGRG